MARVSKKARPRRAPAARKPPAPAQSNLLDDLVAGMWQGIATGDPLRAEIGVATCMALPRIGQLEPDQIENFSAKLLVDQAIDRWGPEGTALLRLLMALGTPRVKRAAGAALQEMTGAGLYPPGWVSQVAVPVQATRRYDVFGDDEAIAVVFRYGEAEHGVVAQVDLTGLPVVSVITVLTDMDAMAGFFASDDDPLDHTEPIGLAQARRRLAGPLAWCGEEPGRDPSVTTLACLPIARARLRRLPSDAPEVVKVSAAERAAAVEEFLHSQPAAEAVAADAEATRFWATVFAGYSERTPGATPDRLGPRRLTRIMLSHVPIAVTVSPGQRRQLESAVTAWTRWSAGRQGLDEAAAARLEQELAQTLPAFDEAYNQPGLEATRRAMANWDAPK
jgi:hypothetical protein